MNLRPFLIALCLAVFPQASAETAPPAQALRYHTALLKTPENTTLFDRFFNAWLDEQPVEALQTFLTQNAADGAGSHLAILARFQLRRSLEDEALATLALAIAARPDDHSLRMDRATVLLRRLDFQNARADLELVAASPHPTLSIDAAKLIGRSHLRQGNTADAIKAWDALLAKYPRDLDLLDDLVESVAAEDRFPQAIQYIDQLIARSNDPYRATLAQLRRAELLARSGMNDEAALACTTALANVGADSWLESQILAQFEKIYRSQDRITDLITALRTLADANPQRTLILRKLAKLEAEDGQADAAIARFREILRRTPGDNTLLDEFIALLTTAGQYPQAIAELQKKITSIPADAEIHLRIAALHATLDDLPATLASLEAARAILITIPNDQGTTDAEPASLRIATLMLSYGLLPEAETLLTTLAAAPNATAAPAETLANHFALTQRRSEAIALLESAAPARDADTLIRISNTIARLGEPARAHTLLASRYDDLKDAPSFLTALALAALAKEAPADAIPPATQLLRLATQETDILDAVELATRAIRAAAQSAAWREKLAALPSPTTAETLLHASLAERDRDYPAVAALLNSQDPAIIRFHVALLQRRGDFPAALAAIQPLIGTPEASTPTFLKSLADLQIQNKQTEAALATLAQWKLAAPSDKTPWTITIRQLESINRLPEAITTTRRALARFTDDPDLSTILASLFESTGSFADAEAIQWRLYEAATDTDEQARIANRLANLAKRASTTTALQEKLQRRALANPRSIAPILAQIELARLIDDQPALRDLLQQALRIQPENPDLREALISLFISTGSFADAEAIYWRLFDAATAAAEQSRIANRLAILAKRASTTAALQEKLERRALANPRSIAPILAQIELARLIGHLPVLRDYLQQALRIQPENPELLGDLAQVQLGEKNVLRRINRLRSLDGAEVTDFPILEAIAVEVATAGMITEAIEYLQKPRFSEANWRTRFLLASLLCQVGRESEAIPILISLFNLQTEIPNLPPTNADPSGPLNMPDPSLMPAPINPEYELQLLISLAMKTLRENKRGIIQTAFPNRPDEVSACAILRLAVIASSGNPEFTSAIEAANIEDLPLAIGLIANIRNDRPNFLALIEKYPARPALIRSQARVHIKEGNPLKALQILRALDGDAASDPSVLEAAISSAAAAGKIPEAIQYLQEILSQDTHWRIRFQLASLLNKVGRKSEAIPIFISLLQTDIPNPRSTSVERSLFFFVQDACYFFTDRSINRHVSGSFGEARATSILHLAVLASSGNPEFTSVIEAANIKDLPFAIDLFANISNKIPNLLPLIEKYPERREIISAAWNFRQLYPADPQTLTILKKFVSSPNIDAQSEFQALAILLSVEPENSAYWEKIHPLLSQGEANYVIGPSPSILQTYRNNHDKIPAAQRPKILQSIFRYINSNNFLETRVPDLINDALRSVRNFDEWIFAINTSIEIYQNQLSEKKPESAVLRGFSESRNSKQLNLHIPTLYSIPINSIYLDFDTALRQLPIDDLLNNIDRFDSPFVRAWIAFYSKDEKLIEKYFPITPPEIEKRDFTLLALVREIDAKNHTKACQMLLELSQPNPAAETYLPRWATISFIATTELLTPEEFAEFKKPLHAAIKYYVEKLAPAYRSFYSAPDFESQILEVAKKHGFTDLVTAISEL